jgi:gluconolactonase
MANGMTLDQAGRLLICEQGTRSEHGRISRLNLKTGAIETIVDQWAGVRLNSPNDVVVKRDGTIWFTDPSYGYLQGFKPVPLVGDYVYRYDPRSGRLSVVADSFDKPNGLAFSPDESVLYIGDSGAIQAPNSYDVRRPHHVIAYDVRDGRHLANSRLFAVTTPGFPDGIKVDAAGHVYVSAFSGVQVFNPSGDLIGEIRLPGAVNFTFGGSDNNIIYITADTAIWAVVTGADKVTAQR